MHRRELLRLIGATAVVSGLSTEQLLALGGATHRSLASAPDGAGFFDSHQMHTVAAAGERIIPATDTPGAMAALCHRFAERIVSDHYDTTRQRRYLDGLVDLDRRAAASHRRLFIELSPTEQDEVLRAVESDAYRASVDGGPGFWRDLKYLTIYGYYTSEVGIEQELQVNHYPGRFEGAAPIASVSR